MSLQLRIVSDLHLEFDRNNLDACHYISHHPDDEKQTLVIAGDLTPNVSQANKFLTQVSERFKNVIYVLGNHDWYGHDISESVDSRNWLVPDNVTIVGNEIVTMDVDGVVVICVTLWANGTGFVNELPDFVVIRNKHSPDGFKPRHMAELNRCHRLDIRSQLSKAYHDGKRSVVITHHLPSFKLCHPRFGTELNGIFASDCDDMLESEYHPEVWIFGHTHDTIDQQLGKTRVVSNPMGYPNEFWKGPTYNSYCRKVVTVG